VVGESADARHSRICLEKQLSYGQSKLEIPQNALVAASTTLIPTLHSDSNARRSRSDERSSRSAPEAKALAVYQYLKVIDILYRC